jgi:pimeloyl-ACP methyl ester carboxylesterase
MRVLPEPRLEGSYRLSGERQIGFAEYGRADGVPIFWFHGTPGGRRQIAPEARVVAQDLGIRLIVLERPGIGESTAHLYGHLAEWAVDVEVIADQLGIHRFACVGLSGGGPYVLACAARFPDRMVAGAVLGGVAPTRGSDAIGGGAIGIARHFVPWLQPVRVLAARSLHLGTRFLMPFRSQLFDLYMLISPAGDKRVFARPEMKQMFLDDLGRASRTRLDAPILDLLLFARHWGFSLRDLRVPIRFWHGDADNIVPLAHATHMATLVADSELRVRHGESHLGALEAANEVYTALLECWNHLPGEAHLVG